MRRSESKIAENTPPLSIRTPDGAVLTAKYRNEHLAFMELLNIAEREHKEKRAVAEGDSRVWLLTDADDADAVLARASITDDDVLHIVRLP